MGLVGLDELIREGGDNMRAIKSNMKDDHRILHCPGCDAEYSGNRDDYFLLPDDHIFVCQDCKVEMELVDKVVTVEYI